MIEAQTMKALIRELFEEEALAIGGLAATHKVNDDFLWELCRNLDAIRIEFLRRLKPVGGSNEDSRSRLKLRPHPAVQELLRRIAENR